MEDHDVVTFEVRKYPTAENLRLNLAGMSGTPYPDAQVSIEVDAARLSTAVKTGTVMTTTLGKLTVGQKVEVTVTRNQATIKIPRH